MWRFYLRRNPNIIDAWVGNFEIGTSWKLIRIPFEQLTIGRGWIKEGAERYGPKWESKYWM